MWFAPGPQPVRVASVLTWQAWGWTFQLSQVKLSLDQKELMLCRQDQCLQPLGSSQSPAADRGFTFPHIPYEESTAMSPCYRWETEAYRDQVTS